VSGRLVARRQPRCNSTRRRVSRLRVGKGVEQGRRACSRAAAHGTVWPLSMGQGRCTAACAWPWPSGVRPLRVYQGRCFWSKSANSEGRWNRSTKAAANVVLVASPLRDDSARAVVRLRVPRRSQRGAAAPRYRRTAASLHSPRRYWPEPMRSGRSTVPGPIAHRAGPSRPTVHWTIRGRPCTGCRLCTLAQKQKHSVQAV
jgi:hypothetical protein